MGFREIFKTPHFTLQSMKKEECRWLKGPEHGKEIGASSSRLFSRSSADSCV
jgi:hypothetical protein